MEAIFKKCLLLDPAKTNFTYVQYVRKSLKINAAKDVLRWMQGDKSKNRPYFLEVVRSSMQLKFNGILAILIIIHLQFLKIRAS